MFGIVLLLVMPMIIDYGVRHLIECGVKARTKSYEATVQYAFGARGFYIASASIFGMAYGAMIVCARSLPFCIAYISSLQLPRGDRRHDPQDL